METKSSSSSSSPSPSSSSSSLSNSSSSSQASSNSPISPTVHFSNLPVPQSDPENIAKTVASRIQSRKYFRNIAWGKVANFISRLPVESLHHGTRAKSSLGKFRLALGKFLESNLVQYTILVLIAIDVSALLGELILEAHFPKEHTAEATMLWVSVSVLWIFAIEQLLLIFSFGFRYFFHVLYLLDLTVISVSLVVDLVLRQQLAGLLALFRLWRVARVVHGLIVAMEENHQKKMHHVAREIGACLRFVQEQRYEETAENLRKVLHFVDPEGKGQKIPHDSLHVSLPRMSTANDSSVETTRREDNSNESDTESEKDESNSDV